MDVATHMLVPLAAALMAAGYLRRPDEVDRHRAAAIAVFGISGAAPDLDGMWDFLSERFDALYFLQHRGFSHTLLGAPIMGLILLAILLLAARLWPRRMSLFAWRPILVPAAILGALTHLVLDAVTYSGVPLWWPFASGRVSLHLFHWLVIWLTPIAGIILLAHAFGRLSRRRVAQAGAILIVALLVLGGVRAAMRPTVEDGTLVFPRSSEWEWTLLTPHANGTWEGNLLTRGAVTSTAWFEARAPPDAAQAIERARDTATYRGFQMGSFGPVVIQADATPRGWNVTFIDVAQRFEALHDPRWTPAEPFDAWGYVAFSVEDGGHIEVQHRGW